MRLREVPEWENYIAGMAGEVLRSKMFAANTQRFVDSLLSEGMTMEEVKAVMLAFGKQLLVTGQRIPIGGAFDLNHLVREANLHRTLRAMSEEEAERLEKSFIETEDGFAGTLRSLQAT